MSDVTIVTKSDTYEKSAVQERRRKRLRNLKIRIKRKINPQGPQELAVQGQQVEQDYKHQNIPDPEKILLREKKHNILTAYNFY